MTPRQRELIDEVCHALKHPEQTPYYAKPFKEAANILLGKLDEVKQISDHEQAMKDLK